MCRVQVSADGTARARELATPAWIIYPRYVAGAVVDAEPAPQGRRLAEPASQQFQSPCASPAGVRTLADVVERCDVYDLHYSDLDEALACFARLVHEPRRHGSGHAEACAAAPP